MEAVLVFFETEASFEVLNIVPIYWGQMFSTHRFPRPFFRRHQGSLRPRDNYEKIHNSNIIKAISSNENIMVGDDYYIWKYGHSNNECENY